MTKNIGFKFKPTFESSIDYFEVRGFDHRRNWVLTTVHTKNGETFEDHIEQECYDAAFDIGEYERLL